MSTLTPLREAHAPDTRRDEFFYRPGLDILRAFAFLLVFTAHGLIDSIDKPTQLGAIARTGEFGVCIFFFLSSYLITELLLREKRTTDSIQIPAFYVRRILRIWPLYFTMIAIGWARGLVSPSHRLSGAWLAALLLLYTNWYTAGHDYPPGFLFPLWSISLEEQFYLLWPLLVKYLNSARLLLISLFLIAAAYFTMYPLLARGASLDPGLWVNSLVQFQFFALGTATAILVGGRVPKLSASLRWVLFAAGLVCLRTAQAAAFNQDTTVPHDFLHIAPRFVAALAGCSCLFLSFLPFSGGRGQRFLIYLGKISYGLYVFHVLWLGIARHLVVRLAVVRPGSLPSQLLTMAVALPLTLGTAMISYRYLESPFLRFKKFFTVVRSRPV